MPETDFIPSVKELKEAAKNGQKFAVVEEAVDKNEVES